MIVGVMLVGFYFYEYASTPSRVTQGSIVPEDLVIKQGINVINKIGKRRCWVDSLQPTQMALGITLKETGDKIIYTSTYTSTIEGKIWFFDEGGGCKTDYARLLSAHAFL